MDTFDRLILVAWILGLFIWCCFLHSKLEVLSKETRLVKEAGDIVVTNETDKNVHITIYKNKEAIK